MASRFIANARVERHDPFDFVGFLLSGCAIAGLAFGFSAMGLEFLPTSIVASLLCIGAIAAVGYLVHAKRTPAPILDLELFRLPTFRASIFGGFLFRLGIGALPFLLPLLLQVGFHLTPFQSGLITFTAALGAMFMKAVVASVLNRFGYRNVLIYNALISSVFLAACATFVQGMPFAAMVAILLSGGFLLTQFGGGHAPWPLHAMAGLGIVMMLIFGHVRFAVFPRIRRAVQSQDWPRGARAVGTVRHLVTVNLVLGVVTIGTAVLARGF